MPFCIIFFAISILFVFSFKVCNKYRVLVVLTSILAVLSVFVGDLIVGEGIYINVLLVAFFAFAIIVLTILNKPKHNFVSLVVSLTLSFVYFLALNYNIFWSLDYYLTFSLILSIMPVIICSADVVKGLNISTFMVFSILIQDSVFWWRELQYIEFNAVNILNLVCILYIIAICVGTIRRKISVSKGIGEKYEKNV